MAESGRKKCKYMKEEQKNHSPGLNSFFVCRECFPAVAVPHQNAPTSSDVNFYECDAFVEDQKVTFLDLEGENGGQPPRVL